MKINILVYTLSSGSGPLILGLDVGQFQRATFLNSYPVSSTFISLQMSENTVYG